MPFLILVNIYKKKLQIKRNGGINHNANLDNVIYGNKYI